MTTVVLLIVLAIGVAVLYLLEPDATIKKLIYFVLAICVLVWFLTVLGVLPAKMHLP